MEDHPLPCLVLGGFQARGLVWVYRTLSMNLGVRGQQGEGTVGREGEG